MTLAKQIVKRLEVAAASVAEDIKTGKIEAGRTRAFTVLLSGETRPVCALGHVLSRAFGNPKFPTGGRGAIVGFEQAFDRSVEVRYPKIGTRYRNDIRMMVRGREAETIERVNDQATLTNEEIRRERLYDALMEFVTHCKTVRILALPAMDDPSDNP